ncbi:hypothetical protein [Sulfuricurvum sp.]|uniref:hypothetical protein n=1 Tax=Sulfuricurvum sp. TaxID=2025608 RepID=UPI00198E895E|nr:hypothetical protein [Sulfuricurvum sp.]MBD3807074.1 hypothetical protein [Sulfuricurvum sp.]
MKSLFLISLLSATLLMAQEGVHPLKAEYEQLFEKRKKIEEQSHNERIRILQEADSCIKSAKTPQEYKACEQKEQQSRQQLKEKLHPQLEALKNEREVLKEKVLKQREERMKNQQYPKGTIATH